MGGRLPAAGWMDRYVFMSCVEAVVSVLLDVLQRLIVK